MTEHHFDTPRAGRAVRRDRLRPGRRHRRPTPTESRVELTGRHADEVQVVQLDGRDLRVIAPARRTGFFSADDDSLFATITVPTGSDLAVRTGSADLGVVGEIGSSRVKTGSGDVASTRSADPPASRPARATSRSRSPAPSSA